MIGIPNANGLAVQVAQNAISSLLLKIQLARLGVQETLKIGLSNVDGKVAPLAMLVLVDLFPWLHLLSR